MRIPRYHTYQKLLERGQVTLSYDELVALLHLMNEIEVSFPPIFENLPSQGYLDESDGPLPWVFSFYPEGAAMRDVIRAWHMPWPRDFFDEGAFTPQPAQYALDVWPIEVWQQEVAVWQQVIEVYKSATRHFLQEEMQKPLYPLPSLLSYPTNTPPFQQMHVVQGGTKEDDRERTDEEGETSHV